GTGWSAAGPEAVLYADASLNAVVGTHYAGPLGPTRPIWESTTGSKVMGMVLERCPQDPAAVPLLLLGAAASQVPAVLNNVTVIQRLNTTGGNAPTVPGNVVGKIARVPYTAGYFFYKSDN